jgi:hypothetical protein
MPPSHNMYNVFAKEDNTDTRDTTMTNIAALMMGSTIKGVQTATIPESVALSANQTALMNQMAVLSYTNVPPPPTLQYQPLIQQLTIPVQQPFSAAATGGFNPGNQGGGRGGCSRQRCGGCGGGRNQHTPFANYGCTQGVGSVGQGHSGGSFVTQALGVFTLQAPSFVPPNPQNIAITFSNTVKSYANWNVYDSCRFDVEGGHTSVTCHKA